MTDELLVIREDSNGLTTLTLNRPEKRNAMNVALFEALERHLAAIEAEADKVNLVLLRANGKVFSAGADLGPQQKRPRPHFQAQVIDRLARLPQPVVAAVHGHCFTGGMELALAADIIIAAESARFADTHGKFALVPGWGLTARLPARIGRWKAQEMSFTARQYSALEAAAMGLVNVCVADAGFEAAVTKFCADILANSPHSNRGYKQLYAASAGLPVAQALASEIFNSPGVGPDFAARVGGKFG